MINSNIQNFSEGKINQEYLRETSLPKSETKEGIEDKKEEDEGATEVSNPKLKVVRLRRRNLAASTDGKMELRKLAPIKTSNPTVNILPAKFFQAKQAEKEKINFEELIERQRDHTFL